MEIERRVLLGLQPHRVHRIVEASQPGSLRREAAELARVQGLSEEARGRVAIVATEMGTNLVKHVRQGGEVLVRPLEIPLGMPTEQAALEQVEGVRAWVEAWRRWQGVGELSWSERHWKTLGVQRLPGRLTLHGPGELAQWAGENTRWERAQSRYNEFAAQWPPLAQQLPRFFEVLADYSDADYRRLMEMLEWINIHPKSNLYPRQIPVAGADSKWQDHARQCLARGNRRHRRPRIGA